MNSKKRALVYLITLCFLGSMGIAFLLGRNSVPPTVGYSPDPEREYLVGAEIYQLSAEANAQMLQAFRQAKTQVDALLQKCEDPAQVDWQLLRNENGQAEMYYQGKRVAVLSDIDDTLVDGAHYSADVIGTGGDWNNAAFARFLMSEKCTALPGAVELMNYCSENGIEVFYVTNRYDQGYKIGQSDSMGSYQKCIESVGEGSYRSADGKEIGVSLYQLYGKSAYDITLASMEELGFPVDDQHLIVNDLKLKGSSKESARQAIRNGCTAFPNGVVPTENALGCKDTLSCEAHEVVMLLGDQLSDFTDVFDEEGMDAVNRVEALDAYRDKLGSEWILLPNAVYGAALNHALDYGVPELFGEYSYVTAQKGTHAP